MEIQTSSNRFGSVFFSSSPIHAIRLFVRRDNDISLLIVVFRFLSAACTRPVQSGSFVEVSDERKKSCLAVERDDTVCIVRNLMRPIITVAEGESTGSWEPSRKACCHFEEVPFNDDWN